MARREIPIDCPIDAIGPLQLLEADALEAPAPNLLRGYFPQRLGSDMNPGRHLCAFHFFASADVIARVGEERERTGGQQGHAIAAGISGQVADVGQRIQQGVDLQI